MAEFPPRLPKENTRKNRVFLTHYFNTQAFASLGFLVVLFGVLGGLLLVPRWFDISPFLSGGVGAVLGAIVFFVVSNRWIASQERALDEYEQDIRDARELETLRAIEEMKRRSSGES